MTAKEKAQELVSKYYNMDLEMLLMQAKQCALIAVDEILNSIDWHEFETPNEQINFWNSVKTEINAL